jgi:hypothetical protein
MVIGLEESKANTDLDNVKNKKNIKVLIINSPL